MISFALAAEGKRTCSDRMWMILVFYLFILFLYLYCTSVNIYIGTRLIEFKISRYTIGNLKKNLITLRPTLTCSIVCINVCVCVCVYILMSLARAGYANGSACWWDEGAAPGREGTMNITRDYW